MKILFVVPYVPNLIRVRPYQFIQSLTRLGHSVTVMTLWSSEQEREDAEKLKQVCEAVHAFHLPAWQPLVNLAVSLPQAMPLQANYCWQPELNRAVHKALFDNAVQPETRFDLVHIEHLRGVQYGLSLKTAGRGRIPVPVVWDSVDCISYLFGQAVKQVQSPARRAVLNFDLQRTRRYEGKVARYFDRVLVTSRVDLEKLAELAEPDGPLDNLSVVPNGVDLDYFQPDLDVRRQTDTLVVSGKMSYHANVAMVHRLIEAIMPLVWQNMPSVKVTIVGKDPPAEIRALAADPRVTVTGTVDDIRPYLQRAALAVAPVPYGAGIQNKVLEAMACATPVIASSQAVSALDIVEDRDLLVADTIESFARAVVDLLSNSEIRDRIGQAGRTYVEQQHCWSSIAGSLETIYREVRENTCIQIA